MRSLAALAKSRGDTESVARRGSGREGFVRIPARRFHIALPLGHDRPAKERPSSPEERCIGVRRQRLVHPPARLGETPAQPDKEGDAANDAARDLGSFAQTGSTADRMLSYSAAIRSAHSC